MITRQEPPMPAWLSPLHVAQVHEIRFGDAAGLGAELAHLLLRAGLRPRTGAMSRRRCGRSIPGGWMRGRTGRSRPGAGRGSWRGRGPVPGAVSGAFARSDAAPRPVGSDGAPRVAGPICTRAVRGEG